MSNDLRWLLSTIGKRSYIAEYLREVSSPGARIVGTGCDKYTVGFLSCDVSYVVPEIASEKYLNAVFSIVEKENINAVLTLSDLDLKVLPSAREKLQSNGVSCFFPDSVTSDLFLDKQITEKYLKLNGFDTPQTYTSLEDAERNLNYPIIIKPARGSASKGFSVINNGKQARKHWKTIDRPIAQEYIQGKQINVEACSSPEGELLGISVWEKISSISGETLIARTVDNKKAIELVKSMLVVRPIPGPIDVDLIETENSIYIIEVNTRFGGGYPASHLAGAEFPAAMVGWMKGIYPSNIQKYKQGVSMMKKLVPVVFEETLIDYNNDSYS